jgi:hypothetical protein
MPQHAAQIVQLNAQGLRAWITGHLKPGLSSLLFSQIWIGGYGWWLFLFSCEGLGVDTGWEQLMLN